MSDSRMRALSEHVLTASRTDAVKRVVPTTSRGRGSYEETALVAVDRLMGVGHAGDVIDLARELLATPGLPTELAARLRLKVSSVLAAAGRSAEAVDEADEVLAEWGLSDHLYMAATVHRLIGLVGQEDLPTARDQAEAILGGSAGPGGDVDLAGALTIIALSAWTDGRAAEAIRLFGVAMCRVGSRAPELLCLNPRLSAAVALAALGNFDAADAAIARADAEIGLSSDPFWAAGLPTFSALVDLEAGRLDEAAAGAQAGREMSDETGVTFFRATADWVLGTVALHRGDLSEAAHRVACYRGAVRPVAAGLSPSAYLWLAARVAEAQGREDLAIDTLNEIVDHVHDHQRLLVDEPAAAAWLVGLALRAGDQVRAESVVLCIGHLTERNPEMPSLRAAAAQARGLLDRNPSDCLYAAETHVHPWAKGSAHEDAAMLLAEAGDRRNGERELDAAVGAYEQAGATRDATRVRVRSREGDGLPRRGDRPELGWAGLTDSERQVARLVSDGLTNAQAAARLDISRHTIDFHLRQIFRKLDIGSRVELARIVATRPARSTDPTSG